MASIDNPGHRITAESILLHRRLLAFAFMSLFEFFYGWTWNTVDVLRPQIRDALGLTLPQAGSAYTAQGLGALVGAIALGQIADHFGRRRTFFAMVIGYAVLGAAGTFVTTYPMLLVQRFLLGFFLGANFPVLGSIYMGLFPSDARGKITSIGNGVYNLAVVALGYGLAATAHYDWRVLLWGAALPPLLLAPLIFVIVPDDRRMIPWGDSPSDVPLAKLPVLDLFGPELIGLTGRLFLLVGLNFFAYQAFAGWVTTFLRDVRGFTPDVVGTVVAMQFAGATIGSFFWGWFADRYGRRSGAAGFLGGALAVLAYLHLFRSPVALEITGAIWGFMIASSVSWAPWMSELFPARLRSTAMSIFNWGRLISMTAPLVTGWIAEAFGLGAAMLLSAASFGLGALVWILLPETLPSRRKLVVGADRASPTPS